MKIERFEIRDLGESLLNRYIIEGFDHEDTEPVWRDFAHDLEEAATKIRLCSIGIHIW